ncbi:MAG TPA: endonuclease domain-containing protein [Longimicrobium sp.]|nr:endonuclease domain-containing protein [Longimicrobium sp.]
MEFPNRWRTSRQMRERARVLRGEMTPAETALWSALRRDAVDGLSFRRQHAIRGFILDFFCPSRKLAVEVDGEVHEGQQERDAERTAALALLGIRVIRFRNDEVLGDLTAVVERIRWEAKLASGEEPEV